MEIKVEHNECTAPSPDIVHYNPELRMAYCLYPRNNTEDSAVVYDFFIHKTHFKQQISTVPTYHQPIYEIILPTVSGLSRHITNPIPVYVFV